MPRTRKDAIKNTNTPSIFGQVALLINHEGEIEYGDDGVKVVAHHRSPKNTDRVQQPFTVADYDIQRPAEADPKDWDSIFLVCDHWYQKNGLVRNIIDLMADFCVAGVQVSSPDIKEQAFLRAWFKRAKGIHVSERIANMLYRLGNVGIRKMYGYANLNLKEKWQKAVAQLKVEINIPEDEIVDERFIPYKYVTIPPKYIRVPSPEVSAFLDEPYYGLRISKDPLQQLNQIDNEIDDNALMGELPEDIRTALTTGKTVKMDNDRFTMMHYKKDDMDKRFSYPLIYAALSDLFLYSKMSLADRNVVDSAIKRIILVKVGDPKTQAMPTKEYMDSLSQKIHQAAAGGSKTYVVTHPFVALESDNSSIASFLGDAKYKTVLEAIYATFGIPAALTGTASGTAANNFMAMKVLVKKLEYVRRLLIEFWMEEFKQVCAAFDFTHPVFLTFTYQELGDESNIKKLIEAMYDRDVISDESYRYFMGADHELEEHRLKREKKARKKGDIAPKAGPFHNANLLIDLMKIGLQQGMYSIEDLGFELADSRVEPSIREPRLIMATDEAIRLAKAQGKIENDTMDHQHQLDMETQDKQGKIDVEVAKNSPAPVVNQSPVGKPAKKATKKAVKTPSKSPTKKAVKKSPGKSGEGRPKNSKDTNVRKKRTMKKPNKT